MPATKSHRNKVCGQTLVLAIVLLSICSTLMLGLFKVSMVASQKIRLQLSADMAVLSALNCQANGLNSIAMANRAILANDALAGQLNAFVSETTFYRRLAEKFKRLLRFIPYVGAISGFLSTGIHIIEKAARKTASLALPLAHHSNAFLKKGQETVRYLLPLYSLRAARSALGENTPQAQMTIASEALILRQARHLQGSIGGTEPGDLRSLKLKTMDQHTLRRNWRISIAGLSPVKKTGGTRLSGGDLVAGDRLRMKAFRRLRWRWKTVLHTQSRTSDFGYKTPAELMSIDTSHLRSALSLSILVRSKISPLITKDPFDERELLALSSGRLTYRRPSNEVEAANLFNPFWKAQLAPVAGDPAVRRILPGVILKEVRH